MQSTKYIAMYVKWGIIILKNNFQMMNFFQINFYNLKGWMLFYNVSKKYMLKHLFYVHDH